MGCVGARTEVNMVDIGHGVTVSEMRHLVMLTDERIEEMKRAGVTCVRVFFTYPYQNTDGRNVPTSACNITVNTAKKLKAAGMTVVAQTFWPGGETVDTQGNVGWVPIIPPVYESFDDKYFTKATQTGVKYIAEQLKDVADMWIVSNEPDVTVFTGAMTEEQIINYIKTSTAALREAGVTAPIGINLGVVQSARSRNLIQALYLDERVLDYLGIDAYFGTLTPGDVTDWRGLLNDISLEYPGLPLIIAEYSYSTAGAIGKNNHTNAWTGVYTPEAQAEYRAECLKIFAEFDNVHGDLWYGMFDSDGVCWQCGDPACRMYSSWGLYTVGGVAKPALYASQPE